MLILLHEYRWQQKKLIEHLSKDFDVYVHVDKRSSVKVSDIHRDNVHVFKKFRVFWGHYNQIRATLFLFETASLRKYDRYVFISGSDIPLKTNSEIQAFFDGNNAEYLGFRALPNTDWPGNGGLDRVDYYSVRVLSRGKTNRIEAMCWRLLALANDACVTPLMKRWGIRRRIEGLQYYGGGNWMDLTDGCVSQIVCFIKKNKWFLKKFKHTRCADEIFFQTIICNFVKNVHLENKCLRYSDWHNCTSHPRVLCMADYPRLKGSPFLFARKFDSVFDSDVIRALYRDIETEGDV